jgi:guanylate kinase
MELALKQATEETHKQMLAAQKIEENTKSPEQLLAQSSTMQDLKAKHSREEQELKAQIASEEQNHLKEINEMEQYQTSIIKSEADRKVDDEATKLHAEELKLL